MSLSNAWVDAYLEALLSAGLASEAVLPRGGASEAGGGGRGPSEILDPAAAGDPSAPNVAARYYLQQILAMDEESIQQAWMKVRARSSVRLSGERDARLEHVCWRVWSMRRRAATPRALRPPEEDESPDASDVPDVRSEAEDGGAAAVDDEELTKLYGAASPGGGGGLASPPASAAGGSAAAAATAAAAAAPAAAPKPKAAAAALRAAPARAASLAGAAAAVAAKAAAAELPATPLAAASGGGAVSALAAFGLPPVEDEEGPEAAADEALNLGEGRVPKLYCVLISLHGLVRGDRMELGKDPDTGGQVKYVVELARALARHPAVHRVDLLTRLIRDPAVSPDYGVEEEALDEGNGRLGGAFIVRLPCGPTNKYIRKEALWPHVREFADNTLTHTTSTLARLAAEGEGCELYTVHGHYADAGEVASLVSATLGVDMVLTGHSLGRNKLDHLLKSRSMTRREIEGAYAISRRIEAEERSLDAASLVFASTRQEVKDQWGLYDGYDPDLERILRARPRRGRHFPAMSVVPPGLDFSGLKIDCPPSPWQQLDAAAAAASATGGGGGGLGLLLSGGGAAASPGGHPPRSRRASAVAAEEGGGGGGPLPPPPPVAAASPRRSGGGGFSPAAAGALAGSPFLRDAPPPDLLGISGGASPSPAAGGGGGGGGPAAGLVVGGASPRGPPTPLPGAGGSGPLSPPGGGGGGGVLGTVYEDPPIWREIFRFLRNPRKPVILAMSRPDAKKNIATLVRAYGESPALRQIANLVLVLGNRSVIDSMAAGSARVLEGVLKLVDAYDLYGSVAYPKAHSQEDISHIYLLPHHTRGVFANVALQEPFGLTLIEAAAHGVPIVATTHGGPVDIVATLKNGLLVEPTDQRAVGDALLRLLTDPGLWEQCAGAGRDNIGAYSWQSHCGRCLAAIEREKTRAVTRRKTAMRSTFSVDLDRVADTLQSEATAAAASEAPAAIMTDEAAAAEEAAGEAAADGAAAAPGPPEVAPPPPGLRRLALGGARGAAESGGAPTAPAAAAPLAAAASLEAWAAGPQEAAAAAAAGLAPIAAADSAADGSTEAAAAATAAPGSPLAAVSPLRSGGRAASLALSPRAGSLDARAFSVMLAGGGQPPIGGPDASSVRLPLPGPVLAPKARYVVLLIDSADAVAGLSGLLSRRGAARALASLAAAGGGARVGVGAASCFPLADTLRLLSGAGLAASDLDFLITNCGAQIFYGGAAAAAPVLLTSSSAEAVRTVASPEAAAAAAPDCLAGLQQCVADEAYGAHVDASWCKISVRRVLAQLLAQPGLLTGLAGSATTRGGGSSGSGGGLPGAAAAAGAAARGASVRISADTDTGAHHLLLTVRRAAAAAAAGAGPAAGPVPAAAAPPPALSPRELLSLVARMKKRLRSSGLRTQVTAQLEADGTARLHITPLRASRALGLRFLARRHGVDMRKLVLVGCARELSGGAAPPAPAAAVPQRAAFAASDAEDLLGGVQGVLLVPPSAAAASAASAAAAATEAAAPAGPPAAAAGGAGGAAGSGGGAAGSSGLLQGFPVDLAPHSHDGRVQLLTAAPK